METVVEVIGVNGDVVTIAGENVGVDGIWMATDLEGLYDPEVEVVTQSPGNRAGARYVSHRILERTINFIVTISNDDGVGKTWRARDYRWRRLWAFDRYTKIRVTTDDGVRVLKVRLAEIQVDTTYDPHVNDATDVLMTVVADDPFWYGTEFIKDVIVNKEATITVLNANPTENPVFPVWVLEAPGEWTVPDWSPETPDKAIKIPWVPGNSDLLVQTDPMARQVVAKSGLPVWTWMNGVRFQKHIPPFTDEVKLKIQCKSDEPKQAQLRLVRPYNRPWGL